MMRHTIVIVGAGFSGTVLAANLLRRPPSGATDIVLIERGAEMGRGVAYAAREFPYLLNVPAGRLSADSHEPEQFLRYAQRRLAKAGSEDFLPRAVYGDYLQDVLLEAERAAPPQARLMRQFGEVRRIARRGEQALTVEFANGAAIAMNMITPPIVGVPALLRCPCGPSSRTC